VFDARLSAGAEGAWCVLVREGRGAAIYRLGEGEAARRLVTLDTPTADLAFLDLDADTDDDLVTAEEELRVWINVLGEFREAGDSPYVLEAPVLALIAGSLDEKTP
jgi:hypothetical protein